MRRISWAAGVGVAIALMLAPLPAASAYASPAAAVRATPTLSCTGSGSGAFSPGIPASGTPVKQTAKLSGKYSKCVGSSVTPASGTWSSNGKVTPAESCEVLVQKPFTLGGTLSVSWKNGKKSTVAWSVKFPPVKVGATTDTGKFTNAKVTGTEGTGTASGSLTIGPSNSKECISKPLTTLTVQHNKIKFFLKG
jgi:hypothetical protein